MKLELRVKKKEGRIGPAESEKKPNIDPNTLNNKVFLKVYINKNNPITNINDREKDDIQIKSSGLT